jgi:hypothetical protein
MDNAQLHLFLKEADILESATLQGVGYADYLIQVARVEGFYLKGTWPENEVFENLEVAVAAWIVARDIWACDVSNGRKRSGQAAALFLKATSHLYRANVLLRQAGILPA